MRFSEDELNDIYDKRDGCCDYCGKRLSWNNYAKHGKRGAWHVDHSVPKSLGGTDLIRNLFAACIACNLEKSDRTGKYYRQLF
jgi:5-methylcytosine-specific restriction endonuclease McrA